MKCNYYLIVHYQKQEECQVSCSVQQLPKLEHCMVVQDLKVPPLYIRVFFLNPCLLDSAFFPHLSILSINLFRTSDLNERECFLAVFSSTSLSSDINSKLISFQSFSSRLFFKYFLRELYSRFLSSFFLALVFTFTASSNLAGLLSLKIRRLLS